MTFEDLVFHSYFLLSLIVSFFSSFITNAIIAFSYSNKQELKTIKNFNSDSNHKIMLASFGLVLGFFIYSICYEK